MVRRSFFIICVLIIYAPIWADEPAKGALLRDGFVVRALDGVVRELPDRGVWVFSPAQDINDGQAVVPAGTELELLPSAMLEQMIADANGHEAKRYRLWARVTRYKGRNFLFTSYFLPIVAMGQQPPSSQRQAEPNEPSLGPEQGPAKAEPNEAAGPAVEPNMPSKGGDNLLEIPKEILEKVRGKAVATPRLGRPTPGRAEGTQKEVQTAPAKERKGGDKIAGIAQTPSAEKVEKPPVKPAPALVQDSVLVGRTAVLDREGPWWVFELYGLGQNIEGVRLRLLPCEALELIEQQQEAISERARFWIAGIQTQFEGRRYLLLQRAVRAYSYGNFRPVILR